MKKLIASGKPNSGWKLALSAVFVVAACGLPAAMATTITLSPDQEMRRADDYYNIKVPNSSLRLGFTGTFTAGWDSNIGRSGNALVSANTQSGFYMQPGLSMAVDWPISPYFSVNSEIGIAYIYYFGGKGRNDFILTGDSGGISTGISGEMKIGQNGKLTFGDNISRSLESLQSLAATGMARYSTTTNETFLQYENDLNETLHTVDRYAHTISWHSPGTYKYLDYQSDMGDFLLLRDMWKGGQLGPYFTITETYYSSPQQGTNLKRNDVTDYKFGLAFRHVGPMTISGRIGWQLAEFNENNNVATEQGSSPTYNLDVVFGTGSNIIHRFSSSYGLDTQFLTPSINFARQWQNTYSANWRLHKEWILGGDVSWLNRNESDNGVKNSNMLQFGIGPTYELSRNTQLSLRYQYTKNMSDQAASEYDRNLITFTLTHKF
jgi:hypothetical protein